MSQFKTIIFDLSDVLIKGLVGSENHLSEYSKEIKATDFFMSELDDFFLGKISEEEYWQSVLRKNKWELSIDNLKKAVRKNFEEIEGTREIIEKLRKRYKLGLLSIHTREWVEYCDKKLNYSSLFDVICYSFQISVCKPSKKAFQIILNKLQAKVEESLFIDDSLRNIESAKELGLSVILFKSSAQLRNELVKLGINL